MNDNTLKIGSFNLHYVEKEGDSPTVFLIHGNSSSARSYQNQLENLPYRVIAVDLPGHGKSEKAPETTYNMPGYASLIVEAAQHLNATDGVFVGWSLGGHILLEAVPHLPDAKGFMIFGTPPVSFPLAEDAFLPTPNVAIGFTPELTQEQMEAYVTSFFAPGISSLPPSFMEDIAATDGTARLMLGASIQPDGFADEVEIMATMTQPLAILHGEQEQLVNLEYIKKLSAPTLWRGEVQVIPGAGHAPHWETPDAFNALIEAFVQDVQ